jgi:hypothetical protein
VVLEEYKQTRLILSRYTARKSSESVPLMSRNEMPRGSRSSMRRGEGGREGREGGEGASYLGNAGDDVGTDPGHVAVAIHLPQEAVKVHAPAHHRSGLAWRCVLCVGMGRREGEMMMLLSAFWTWFSHGSGYAILPPPA